jgi:hypothetical protein
LGYGVKPDYTRYTSQIHSILAVVAAGTAAPHFEGDDIPPGPEAAIDAVGRAKSVREPLLTRSGA